MASARELLAQADALMRRNRAGVVDTEIPELTDMVAMIAYAPSATPALATAPAVLDDVPELTEAVEEIEIESIVELPEDLDGASGWLHHGEHSVVGRGPDSIAASIAERTTSAAASVERTRSTLAAVAKPVEVATPLSNVAATPVALSPKLAPVASVVAAPPFPTAPGLETLPTRTDDRARWEALADEIRMQVLQRLDIFTDTRLSDQLSAKLQPIVDRASAEMVSTINAHVGELLRSYISEAVEREIEKWRGPPR